MVVDDEPDVLKSIRVMLESLECEVRTMEDSREAAKRLERERFDGILLDARLPYLNGLELTKLIRASRLNRSAPVVILAGSDDLGTMREGFKAGASCFLAKPLDQKRLYALVKAMRGPMLQEKRRHVRLPFWAKVKCRVGAQDGYQFISNSLTISESGLSLDTSSGLREGQELELEFSVPDSDKPVKTNARVVRALGPGLIGVEFLNLELKSREAIRRYVEGEVKL
jgi:DNA-binding response OmpR family regulator